MPYIDIKQKRYYYEAVLPSSKEPQHIIVFIHGAGGSHKNWACQIEQFGKDHLALALDLPGHGQSGGNPAKNIMEYVNFLELFARHLIGSPFILVGHSMGGAIAMSFAHDYPQMLSGLVLAGTGCRLKVLPAILNSFAKGDIFRDLINYLYGKDTKTDLLNIARSELENVSPKVFFNDFSACNNFDISDKLDEISTPALIISACEDRLTPVKYGEYLNTHLPDSYMHTIRNAGHMMMLEQPQEFNKLLHEFILQL